MKKLLLAIVIIFSASIAFSQNEDSIFIRRIADEILIRGKAYDDLRVLTKQIGGRLSGSPQMVKAENWGLKTFQSLSPDRAWLQECMVPHWIRGGKDQADAKTRNGNSKKLDVLALGNSKGTGAKGINAEVVEVKSFDDLQMKKDLVKNKIVFYNYPFNQSFVHTFEAYSDAVRYRSSGPSQAARYGALA